MRHCCSEGDLCSGKNSTEPCPVISSVDEYIASLRDVLICQSKLSVWTILKCTFRCPRNHSAAVYSFKLGFLNNSQIGS